MTGPQPFYREYVPAAALRPYVECFWLASAPPPVAPRRVLPDGCIDVLFDLHGPRLGGTLVGTMTRPLLYHPAHAVEIAAVRFRPGGAAPFLGFPADALTDRVDEASPVWNSAEIVDRLLAEPRFTGRIRILEETLLRRLPGVRLPDPRVTAAARLLASGEEVAGAAAEVELSRQQLTRLFRRDVGIGAKRFARVMRLRRLLKLLETQDRPDWPGLALEAGYWDQSHLISECRTLAGRTPTELTRRRPGGVPFFQDGRRRRDAQ